VRLPRSIEPCQNRTDTYGQRQGHFSPEQEQRLRDLRDRLASLLAQRQEK
jgi:hypothetical protein